MKLLKTSIILLIATVLLFSGCADSKTITTTSSNNYKRSTHTYVPYGIFDAEYKRNPNIEYEVSIGNVAWSIVLIRTVIVPVILVGWYLWEPVGPKIETPEMRGIQN